MVPRPGWHHSVRAAPPPRAPLRGARARLSVLSRSAPALQGGAAWVIALAAAALACLDGRPRAARAHAPPRLRSPPTRGVFSCRGCCGPDPDALAGVPEVEGSGASRPADPHVRAARQVRRGPRGGEPAGSRRRAGPRVVRAPRAHRRDRALRSSREIKFETFAMARIRGAIIDELRSLDWVPRSVRTRARQIERAIAALEKELHRAPTDEEIAKKLGVTEEELDDSLLEISRSSVGALDELWSPSGGGRLDRPHRHDRGRDGAGSGDLARADRGKRGARGGDLRPPRAREARRHALLLRGADPPRDRRGARRHRVARLAAPYEGDPAPEGAPLGRDPRDRRDLDRRCHGGRAQTELRGRTDAPLSSPERSDARLSFSAGNRVRGGEPAHARARKDPQRRRRRPPRDREDVARRGAPLPDRQDQPARHGRGRHDRLRLPTRTSTSGSSRSRCRSSTPSGRTARSTSSTFRATRPSRVSCAAPPESSRVRSSRCPRSWASRSERRAPGGSPTSSASRASSS